MWWIILYLIGVVVAYIILAIINDKESDDSYKVSGFFIIMSWLVFIALIIGGVIIYLKKNINYPSLKYFKKK